MSSAPARPLLFALAFATLLASGCSKTCCVNEASGDVKIVDANKFCPAGFTDLGVTDASNTDEAEDECQAIVAAAGFGTDDGSGSSEGDSSCADFCALILSACPEDSSCESSCLDFGGANGVSESAMACADEAEDCTDSNQCFQDL